MAISDQFLDRSLSNETNLKLISEGVYGTEQFIRLYTQYNKLDEKCFKLLIGTVALVSLAILIGVKFSLIPAIVLGSCCLCYSYCFYHQIG